MIRPSMVWSFSGGLALGALFVAAAAVFSTAGSDHVPDCQSPTMRYVVSQVAP